MYIGDWDLKLAKRIANTRKFNGFIGCLTKGPRGSGKSMYNMKNMAQAYFNTEEYDETQAWNKALDNIIFTPEQLSRRVTDNIENDHVSLVWCVDDAAVHFSSYLFFINIYQAALLNATFDTIRTVVSAFLVNCPDKSRLMKSLRTYDDYEVTIYKDRGYERRAVGIKWYSLPDGKRRFRKDFEDRFSCYAPDWIYNKYMLQRKKYLKEINEEITLLREKLSERKKKILQPTLSPVV